MDLQTDLTALPELSALPQLHLAAGTVLFRPGTHAEGFVLLRKGRIEVRLTAASGREILLYAVTPGQSCIQTTLGLLGDETYTGEAVAVTDIDLQILPRAGFLALMDRAPAFRAAVLRAFGRRMGDLTRVLEEVAFEPIDQRLARALLDLAGPDGALRITQAELAARIGSAREVVTRHLQAFAGEGLIAQGRGQLRLLNRDGLRSRARARP